MSWAGPDRRSTARAATGDATPLGRSVAAKPGIETSTSVPRRARRPRYRPVRRAHPRPRPRPTRRRSRRNRPEPRRVPRSWTCASAARRSRASRSGFSVTQRSPIRTSSHFLRQLPDLGFVELLAKREPPPEAQQRLKVRGVGDLTGRLHRNGCRLEVIIERALGHSTSMPTPASSSAAGARAAAIASSSISNPVGRAWPSATPSGGRIAAPLRSASSRSFPRAPRTATARSAADPQVSRRRRSGSGPRCCATAARRGSQARWPRFLDVLDVLDVLGKPSTSSTSSTSSASTGRCQDSTRSPDRAPGGHPVRAVRQPAGQVTDIYGSGAANAT